MSIRCQLASIALATCLVLAALAAPAVAGTAATPQEGEEKVVEREHRVVWVGKEPAEGDDEEYHVQVYDLSEEGDLPHAKRGFLGVALTDLTSELRSHFGAPEQAGVMISKVEPGSPAEAAGLRVADILTAVDGETVASSWDVRRAIRRLEEGDAVALEVVRDGRLENLTATVTEREVAQFDVRRMLGPGAEGRRIMLRLDDEEISRSMEELSERLASPEFKRRIHAFRGVEGGLAERLEALEKRIQELERQLEESNR